MKPIDFVERTGTLQKPAGMSDEECAPLPVYHGAGEFISCWRPTWRERLSILFRGRIWLRVLGAAHPPVSLEGARTVFATGKETP